MNTTFNLATQFRSCQPSQYHKSQQLDFNIHMSNMFRTPELQRMTEKGFKSSKHYQIVGMKEIKNLELKTRKGTKLGTRRYDEYPQRPASKQSENQKNCLLTKEEVLSGLPKLEKPKELVKIYKKNRKNSQTSQQDDKAQSKVFQTSRIKNEFSLSRLKNILKERANQWNQLQQKEKSYRRNVQKFPTIYKSIELYRTKLQQKERCQQVDSTISKKYTQWQRSLRRKGIEKQQLSTQKSVERVFHDDGVFSTKGSSKLKLQKQWIENKDKDGYQFKLLSHQSLHKRSNAQNFR